MPELLITLLVLAAAVVAVGWALRTFRPEIDRARQHEGTDRTGGPTVPGHDDARAADAPAHGGHAGPGDGGSSAAR